MKKDYLEEIRSRVETLKNVNAVLKGACAAQVVARALNKEEAYDEMLQILDHFRELTKMHGLTWQDMKQIVKIADDLVPDTPFAAEQIFAEEFQTEEAYYGEILKRFQEGRV